MRIKKSSRYWLDINILDKIILSDKRRKKVKAFRFNIDKWFYNAARTNV